MAVTDTYNGDLVKIRQKVPMEKESDTVGLTAAQEEAYALINQEIEKAGASAPVSGTDNDAVLKLAEALLGAGLWLETKIFPAQGKQFSDANRGWAIKSSFMYEKGMKMLEGWIDGKFGESSDDADEWAVHNKVERKFRPAAKQDVDYNLINGREGS